jgi:hypothetical protein
MDLELLSDGRGAKEKREFFLDCPVTLMNAFIRGYTSNMHTFTTRQMRSALRLMVSGNV